MKILKNQWSMANTLYKNPLNVKQFVNKQD